MIEKLLNIVPMALPLVCIILIAISFAILFKKRLAETYFLSICTIIIILFLSGILNFRGSLLLGYGIIICLSFLSLAFIIKRFLRNKKIFKEISLFPSLIIFFLFFLFALFQNYGRMFVNWDEFSHWGIVVKSLYSFDALGTFKDANILFKSYLPGTSLLQYFFVRPFPEFVEYPAYISQNMLFFSIISTFIKKFDLKNFLFIISALLIPLLMGVSFYSTLYVDCILGILFGSIFLFYYYYEFPKNSFSIVMILATSVILTLTKDMGFVFAGIALLVLFFDSLIFQKNSLKNFFSHTTGFIQKIKKFLFLTSPFLAIILIRLIWQIHLKIADVPPFWLNPSEINLQNLSQLNLLPYQREVINLFRNALFNKPILPLEYPIIKILLLIAIVTIILSITIRIKNIKPIRLITTFWGIIAGNIVYILILLVFYTFLISEYEALILASYERYLYSYLIGIFFTFLIFILLETDKDRIEQIKNIYLKNFLKILSTFLLFFIYNSLYNRTKDSINLELLKSRESVHQTIQTREEYNKVLTWNKYFSNKNNQIYIISQGNNGYDSLVILHTLYPTHIKWTWDYSVGLEPYYPELNDPWTMIISPEDWETYVIKNYDFLYLFNYDDNFTKLYGHYFDNLTQYQLYRVDSINGNLKLISIER